MTSPCARPPSPRSAVTIWIAAALLFALCATHFWRFFHDDAFIVLRYADNLLRGLGATWNPGERVEGYTSPLWLLQVSGLGLAGISLRYAAQFLGLGWLALWIGLLVHGTSGSARWVALLVATSAPIGAWSFGGLESVSTGALVTASFLSHQRLLRGTGSPWPMALALGLLILTRPEGLLFLAAILVERLVVRDRSACRALVIAAVAPALLGLFLRWVYYGAWVSNSALVKLPRSLASCDLGLAYLARTGVYWIPPVLTCVLMGARSLVARCSPWLVACGAYLLYVVLIGGDAMPAGRLVIPVLAVATTFCALAIADGDRERPLEVRQRLLWLGACVVFQVGTVLIQQPIHEDGAARTGTYVGILLEKLLPPGTLVGLNSAGATPYYAPDLRFIDMLGLNDAHIARVRPAPLILPFQRLPGHALGDGDYVLARRPDVLILGPAHGDSRPWFYSDLGIVKSEEFRSDFEQLSIRIEFDALRSDAVRAVPPWAGIPGERQEVLTLYARRGSPADIVLKAWPARDSR